MEVLARFTIEKAEMKGNEPRRKMKGNEPRRKMKGNEPRRKMKGNEPRRKMKGRGVGDKIMLIDLRFDRGQVLGFRCRFSIC